LVVMSVRLADPQSGGASVQLPRAQTGSPPQHLLVTLLGDYWITRTEHLPSAALVRLVGEFGVSPVGVRAAFSRLLRRRLLETRKLGRRTFYSLTPQAAQVLKQGGQRIVSFGVDVQPWDGSWTVAVFSVPEQQRDVRHTLRSHLRWLGFAPLYDGTWVSPHASPQAALAVLRELGVGAATVFRGRDTGADPRPPIAAWDLEALRHTYQAFITRYAPLLEEVADGRVTTADALVTRTQVMDTYRTFPALDPELPVDLLPPAWPRERAREIFAQLYDTLGPMAELRVRQVVAEFDPDLAELVRHHTTTDLLASGPRSR
jgi:phenylacetic acid degradation operon negative regulatory protein